jgi:Uma2 family endonuclease
MATPDNTDANDWFFWLACLMRLFAELRDLGKVYGSRVALRLDDRNGPEPDIVFVKKKNLKRVKRGHILGAADLVAEIVSPDSVDRDYVLKRAQYERAGIPEYWIIDELKNKVTLLRLDNKGTYREILPHEGRLYSKALKGFWIRPEWLWQEPRPNTLEVLQQILDDRK